MKLRVRINRQTSRVELQRPDPSLKELIDLIKETVLSAHGLSSDSEFSLSLNGSELLSDTSQTLSSCGIVSGDLICVVLPEPEASVCSSSTPSVSTEKQQTSAMTSNQTCSSSPAAPAESQTSEILDSEPSGSSSEPSGSSWEPILCSEAEEGQAPLSLELLYHSAHATSPSDAIMVAGHLLMLETGFVHQGGELKAGEMPAGWRSTAGVYRVHYCHPLCDGSLAMVVAVCMGPLLVINATLKVNEKVDTVRKLCLKPCSYVSDEWPGESAAAAFRDLSKLSRIFKDQLAYPLIAAAREAMSLPVAFGLAALPPELLLRVLRLLDVVSVVRLSSVCRYFHFVSADPSLWRHLCRRDFADPDGKRLRDTDWRELYKKLFELRARRRAPHHYSHPSLPRDIFNPLPVPLPLHPPLPGIIGGEYDQRPNLPLVLPRPRFDPIGPLQDHIRRPASVPRRLGPMGRRPADVRRGFI